jgi:alkanesulfonate monooxygenase SsuD/methylene tetrahydromethanopterin reductase-like flavin-dependent oxidoreductase (luciferase family)
MIKGERPTFAGKWYRAENALANPRYRDHIPLMIGGSGEKKTIPLAVRHFDHLNVIAGFNQLAGKVNVVRQRCEEIDRDPATLETSMMLTVLLDDNVKPDQIPEEMGERMLAGSADFIAEQVQAKVLDAGIDGVIINLPFYKPGVITAVGDALRPLVGL